MKAQHLIPCLALLLGGIGFTRTALADPYTLTNSNNGDGYLVGSNPSFQLYGADNGAATNYTTYTTTIASATSLTFDWAYTTYDCCGSYWDPAGYVVNGIYTQLSTSQVGTMGEIDSSGTTTVSLNAGDTFGYYVYSPDSVEGRGELAINPGTSSSVTPEPSSLWLLGTGMAGVGGILRRRRLLA